MSHNPPEKAHLLVSDSVIAGAGKPVVISAAALTVGAAEKIFAIEGPNVGFAGNGAIQTLTLTSTSAEDAPGGVGAESIILDYLDAVLAPVSETVTLNGTSASAPTAVAAFRLNRARVGGAGVLAVRKPAGLIRIKHSISALLLGRIEKPWRELRNGVYTVPAGQSARVVGISVRLYGGVLNSGCVIRIYTRTGIDLLPVPGPGVLQKTMNFNLSNPGLDRQISIPVVAQKSDIWMTIQASSGGGFAASAELYIVLS